MVVATVGRVVFAGKESEAGVPEKLEFILVSTAAVVGSRLKLKVKLALSEKEL